MDKKPEEDESGNGLAELLREHWAVSVIGAVLALSVEIMCFWDTDGFKGFWQQVRDNKSDTRWFLLLVVLICAAVAVVAGVNAQRKRGYERGVRDGVEQARAERDKEVERLKSEATARDFKIVEFYGKNPEALVRMEVGGGFVRATMKSDDVLIANCDLSFMSSAIYDQFVDVLDISFSPASGDGAWFPKKADEKPAFELPSGGEHSLSFVARADADNRALISTRVDSETLARRGFVFIPGRMVVRLRLAVKGFELGSPKTITQGAMLVVADEREPSPRRS